MLRHRLVTVGRLIGVGLGLLLALSTTGTHPSPAAAAPPTRSVGTPQDGKLVDGFELPLRGAHYRFYGPVARRGTQWATVETAALVGRAARAVHEATGGPPLLVGDCSLREGGATPRHASHRSGRDVDLLFYVQSADGRPVQARNFRTFDGSGRCTARGCDLLLDVQRTWWLVRTLLASQRPAVQYVFVSDPIRALLLAHAEAAGEHPEILTRARRVLREPSDSSDHADHLHVRVYCASDDVAAGCVDEGPRWRWVADDGRAAPLGAEPVTRRRASPD